MLLAILEASATARREKGECPMDSLFLTDSYREMIEYLGDDDPTTRRRLEEILATEERHAEDLRMLIDALSRSERGALRESGKS
jgi:hypothetical protein